MEFEVRVAVLLAATAIAAGVRARAATTSQAAPAANGPRLCVPNVAQLQQATVQAKAYRAELASDPA